MEEIFSVSSLTERIKQKLESSFSEVRVQGEISNLKCQTSGHFYFTLKDATSQVGAVLFRGYAKALERPPKNGDEVILQGEINVYPPRGAYQLIARSLQFTGVGALLLRLHALKAKLEGQGYFAQERKRKLPPFPRTIGVVTSATGAVIQDIIQILERRVKGFHLVLYPVKVQGEGAAEEIALAIEEMNRYHLADVLIVGRGGGSLEDLWAFNEERVASAIYHSRIPVISAVGHETDFSIADFVADLRAPTPSAAAEIVSSATVSQTQTLTGTWRQLTSLLYTKLTHARRQLEQIRRQTSPLSLLEPHFQRLDELSSSLQQCVQGRLREKRLELLALQKQALALRPDIQVATLKTRLERLVSHLESINPRNLLKKGYCILFQENSPSVILSIRDLKKEDRLRLNLSDGEAHVTVNEIVP